MKTLLNKKEVVLLNPTTGLYDVAHVVKEFQVTQYGIHVDDYDFHTSYFDSYESKAEAEKAKESREAWANKMGDNKYFYVCTREVVVRKFFNINMQKRIARKRSREIDELRIIAKAKKFDSTFDLLGVGLYYPANNILPPLTEDFSERANKVFYVEKDLKEYLIFDNGLVTEVKNFDLNGGHIRWSNKSLLRPVPYDSTIDWDLIEDPCFDFVEAPEF